MKKATCGLLAGLLLIWPLVAFALQASQTAPAFVVESGGQETLRSESLKGRAVILFYEARDAVENSRPLKNELSAFLKGQPRNIRDLVVIVSVVDCSEAAWPFEGFWRDGLEDASQREGFTIYGDWEARCAPLSGFPRRHQFCAAGPGRQGALCGPGRLHGQPPAI
jgi:hypothetical protein